MAISITLLNTKITYAAVVYQQLNYSQNIHCFGNIGSVITGPKDYYFTLDRTYEITNIKFKVYNTATGRNGSFDFAIDDDMITPGGGGVYWYYDAGFNDLSYDFQKILNAGEHKLTIWLYYGYVYNGADVCLRGVNQSPYMILEGTSPFIIQVNSPANNAYYNKDLIINFYYEFYEDIQDLKVILQFQKADETELFQQIYNYGYSSASSYNTAVKPLKNLSAGYWQLKILFYDGNTLIKQSETINFNILGYGGQTTTSTPELTPEAAAGSAPTCGFLDCPADWIIYAIKYAFSFLFVPNSTQQQNLAEQFNGFKDTIQKKPPVGYFYAIKDALQQNITTSTATTTQIMDASTTQAFGAVFNPLKTGLNWILWFAAGAWVFIKIKNLNL